MKSKPLKPFLILLPTLLLSHTATANVNLTSKTDPNKPIKSIKNLTSLQGQTKQTGKSANPKTPKIEVFKTRKGAKVLFVKATELPMVDVRITFNAGSARDDFLSTKKYDKNKYQGTASLTASMLTKGISKTIKNKNAKNKTKNKKVTLSENEIAQKMEALGVNFSTQAYKDMFTISMRSLSTPKYLQPASQLLHDVMNHSSFPTENLHRVKAQRLIALKQASERPQSIASKAFSQAIYDDHPYALPSTGTLQSLPNITRQQLLRFKNKFLVAKNANIAITGDLTLAKAKKLAETLTKDMPMGTAAPKLPRPKRPKAKHIHIPFESTQTTFMLGQLGIDRNNPKNYDLMVANDIFGGGEFHAHLMRELREKRGLTYGAYSAFIPMQTKGPFSISFSTRNDKAKEALKITKRTFKNYLINGATKAEVADTKLSMVNKFPLSIATNKSINGWLGMMGFYDLSNDYIENYTLNVNATTHYSINQAFKDTLQSSRHLVIVTVGPKKP